MVEEESPTEVVEEESPTEVVEEKTVVQVNPEDDWKQAIPEDIRDNPNCAKYSSMESFAKGHLNAVSMLGKEVELKLPENDDERYEFYNKLGRPETAEDYNFTAQEDVPEELKTYVEGRISDYREAAHKAGLSADQASALHDWYMDGNKENAAVILETTTQIQKEGFDALQKEWGEGYERHMTAAKNALAEFGDEGLVTYLEQTGLGDHPGLIKAFANAGLAIKGDTMLEDGESGDTPAALDGQIKEIMGRNEYWDADSLERPALVRKVSDLMKKMHPDQTL